MSRQRIVSCFARLAAIFALFGALALLNSSWAVSPADAADLLPVNGFLNDDGTLNLASAPHGTFDLRGWNVTLDAARGPVLAPLGRGANAPSAVGDWSALGSNGSGNGSLNSTSNSDVRTLAVSGTNLYVGGTFFNVDNGGTPLTAADYIAKWDGTNWSALGSNGSGNGSLNGIVYDLAVSGGDLYVGGEFINVNNGGTPLTAADYIAKWDGTNWSALGSNGSGNGSLSGDVFALAVSGSDLYVGGTFSDVNNGGTWLGAADWIAKWDGANWSALGDNGFGGGSLSSYVMALAVSGSDLYVGGGFTNVNNGGTTLTAADYIARWDGTNWSALGSGSLGNGSLNSSVDALAVSGSDLYVGGDFTDVNNGGTTLTAADYIARWDGTNWSALGSGNSGNGSLNGGVYALAVNGGALYVGGGFTNVNNGGTPLGAADYIARWGGANWSALGSNGSGDGSLNFYVDALAANGSDLYAGGFFINVNNGGTPLTAADFVAKHEINAPAAVNVTGPQARVNANNIALKWQTTLEINIVGFDVYRKTGKREWKKINDGLIQAQHPGDMVGENYRFTDTKVKAGKTYRYKIRVWYPGGHSEWTESVRVKMK